MGKMGHFRKNEQNKSGAFQEKNTWSDFEEKKREKLKLFDFGAFQEKLHMPSRAKYLLHKLFGALQETPRTKISQIFDFWRNDLFRKWIIVLFYFGIIKVSLNDAGSNWFDSALVQKWPEFFLHTFWLRDICYFQVLCTARLLCFSEMCFWFVFHLDNLMFDLNIFSFGNFVMNLIGILQGLTQGSRHQTRTTKFSENLGPYHTRTKLWKPNNHASTRTDRSVYQVVRGSLACRSSLWICFFLASFLLHFSSFFMISLACFLAHLALQYWPQIVSNVMFYSISYFSLWKIL